MTPSKNPPPTDELEEQLRALHDDLLCDPDIETCYLMQALRAAAALGAAQAYEDAARTAYEYIDSYDPEDPVYPQHVEAAIRIRARAGSH